MFCPNCGTSNQTLSFCTNCGASISASSAPTAPPAPPVAPPAPTTIGAAGYGATQTLPNPYLPPPLEPKKKVKPLFIVAPVAAVAVVATVIALVMGQPAGPLTQAQAAIWADSVSVPAELSNFNANTPDNPSDLSSSYYEPKFPLESGECQAISDLERLARYMGRGNAGEQVVPDMLQGFEAWDGKRFKLDNEGSGTYAYSTFDYGVLSFTDEAAAERYVADISSAANSCSSMEDIDVDLISYFQDTEDKTSVPGFENSMRLTYTSAFGFSLLDTTTVIVSMQEFSIAQIGPNVVFTHAVVSEDAVAELGVVMSQLTTASDDVFSQATDSIKAASRG